VTLAKRKPNWRKQAKSGWIIWKEKSLSKQLQFAVDAQNLLALPYMGAATVMISSSLERFGGGMRAPLVHLGGRGGRSTNSTMQLASSLQNRNGYLTDCVRLS
jgi:hypothetical protein